jgi:hypothetical protein
VQATGDGLCVPVVQPMSCGDLSRSRNGRGPPPAYWRRTVYWPLGREQFKLPRVRAPVLPDRLPLSQAETAIGAHEDASNFGVAHGHPPFSRSGVFLVEASPRK